MPNLSHVSETALIALRSRAIEAQKPNPILPDEMGVVLLERIKAVLPTETRHRLLENKMSAALTSHMAIRARQYDRYTRGFLAENPQGLVVSLGCGFDTRYWRISVQPWKYVEVDLPEVIEVKKEILAELATYPMIGCSVTEEGWIDQVLSMQKEQVLFLAEGLFMYLPQQEVEWIFARLSETFTKSKIVFEAVNNKFSKGIWKKMLDMKMKGITGAQEGTWYRFGIRSGRDVEAYGKNIRLEEEWSYFEDPDIQPRMLSLFRNVPLMSRTQWTVKASIG